MTRAELLNSLAERAEAADGAETEEVLEVAFYALNPRPRGWYADTCATPADYATEVIPWVLRRNAFLAKLDAEAYVDAALVLVPDGPRRFIEQKSFKSGAPDEPERYWCRVDVMTAPLVNLQGEGSAPTPALAIVAASLRALAEEIE